MECEWAFLHPGKLCEMVGRCLPPLNTSLLEKVDQEKISLAVSQQVALVGSQSLYEKINKNFKEERFDAIFAKVYKFSCFIYCI